MPLRLSRAALPAALLVALATAGCGGGDGGGGGGAGSGGGGVGQDANPYAGHQGYADPGSRTAQAATQAKGSGNTDQEQVFSRLAGVPQGSG